MPTSQVKLDHTPQYAFGIKHSPYVGSLKGDAWTGNVTQTSGIANVRPKSATNGVVGVADLTKINYNANSNSVNSSNMNSDSGSKTTTSTTTKQLANGGTSSTTVVRTSTFAKGGSSTTTASSRVHSDGHRIRSETFSFKGGPATTTTTRVTTNGVSTNATKAIA